MCSECGATRVDFITVVEVRFRTLLIVPNSSFAMLWAEEDRQLPNARPSGDWQVVQIRRFEVWLLQSILSPDRDWESELLTRFTKLRASARSPIPRRRAVTAKW